ncbi:hypothetical protein [Pseudomonas orientalis]|uniref:hypothetical protein n=1 Tax=Pseudomonas orientalis TaxID=76758 RepID=UPI0012FFDA0E|nr:hypothetical protein [Pseudomonas orientalis]
MNLQYQSTISVEKTSFNEKYFATLLLHGDCKKGFFSILRGKDKKQFTYPMSKLRDVLENLDPHDDTYITINRFFSFGRKKTQCSHITCFFTDLDTYKTEYKDMQPEAILELVLAECEKFHLPNPTLALFSGRGLQLKWLFDEPARANFSNIKQFEDAQHSLQVLLRKFGSDTAAKDLSRVFRLEGTLHTGAKTYTRNLPLPTCNRHTFSKLHLLLTELVPAPPAARIKEKRVKKEKVKKIRIQKVKAVKEVAPEEEFARVKLSLAVNNTSKGNKASFQKKGLLSLNTQRYLDLKRLYKMRGNVTGMRMHFLMWIMNFKALAGQVDLNNFDEEAKKEAALLFEDGDYNLSELLSVLKKMKDQIAGEHVVFNGKFYVPLYTPKNSTLINIFQINEEEQSKMKTIIDDEERDERHRAREMQRRREKGAISREEYLGNSVSKSKPWEALGISRPTYYRRVKAGLIVEDTNESSVRQVRAVI